MRALRTVVYGGLGIALVMLGTLIIRYPLPATGGYVNVGDTFIFALAALFGPYLGMIAGGIGSALADLIAAPVFAPFTLVVKGLEGLIAGWLAHRRLVAGTGRITWQTALSFVAAAAWMVVGYQFTYRILGSWGTALASLPGDAIQGLSSTILGLLLTGALARVLLARTRGQAGGG